MELAIQRPEKLVAALESAVQQGKAGGEGAWLLSLELLQWQHDQAFDERAVEFAVTFEVSPPSWEPPLRGSEKAGPRVPWRRSPPSGRGVRRRTRRRLVWDGVSRHATAARTPRGLREPQFVAQIDMTDVERVDFIFAGALFNATGAGSRDRARRCR